MGWKDLIGQRHHFPLLPSLTCLCQQHSQCYQSDSVPSSCRGSLLLLDPVGVGPWVVRHTLCLQQLALQSVLLLAVGGHVICIHIAGSDLGNCSFSTAYQQQMLPQRCLHAGNLTDSMVLDSMMPSWQQLEQPKQIKPQPCGRKSLQQVYTPKAVIGCQPV